MDAALLTRIRDFLSGPHMQYQMPSAARAALEVVHGIEALDGKNIHRALWALDLSREPAAQAERSAIITAMKVAAAQVAAQTSSRALREAEIAANKKRYDAFMDTIKKAHENKEFWPIETGRTPYEPASISVRAQEPASFVDSTNHITQSLMASRTKPILDATANYATFVLDNLAAPWVGEKYVPLPVGYNKTFCSLFAPLHVPGCKVAIRYLQPMEFANYQHQYLQAKENGSKVPSLVMKDKGYLVPGAPVLYLWSLTSLSMPNGFDNLVKLAPDLVIVDGSTGALVPRLTKSVRWSRLRNYVANHNAKLLVWS